MPFNEKQMKFLEENKFRRISDNEYQKHYGPDTGSRVWVYSSPSKNWIDNTSQILVDRNIFVDGHEECWQDLEKIRYSGLFILGGKR